MNNFVKKLSKDIYVVVAENNLLNDDQGEIVFEQYVQTATLENAIDKSKMLSPRYGKCRIAKLVFINDLLLNK